jgi:hypothetical protein
MTPKNTTQLHDKTLFFLEKLLKEELEEETCNARSKRFIPKYDRDETIREINELKEVLIYVKSLDVQIS